MDSLSKVWLTFAIVFTLLFGGWAVTRIIEATQFDLECKAYLKLAADANTVELAKENLSKAIKFAEENELTDGISAIIFRDPRNDVGFWYDNMKACYDELDKLPDNATPLEKTNMLMKLRESLVDTGESTSVTVPIGISIYPHNVLYCIWGWLSLILAAVFWIALYITY